MATSGQTLNDRINAARYALAGQGLARCVCKATTEEVIGPKKKHLDYLVHCTHEPNVSIPQLANLLIERTNHIYWVVVFKALVTVHHLMSYGNERFIQYLASSNYSFELSTFLDKTAAREYSMSTFIRRYSRYINEKALSYRLLAFDFCKIKRGDEGVFRLMPIDRLLKTLPVLQNQLDTLLEFDCSANDLNNGVINTCFMLLFRDLIGLFACHNDGIINLLNKYFTLNRKMCREALDLYKKFLVRMDKVSDFLRVAEAVGIEKDEIPDLRRGPSSLRLIDDLEQHLQNIESNKKILKNQQPSSSSTGGAEKISSASELPTHGSLTSSTTTRRPSSPNSATSTNSQNDEFSLNSFKDEEVRKALEEEARVLSQYGTEGPTKSNKSTASKAIASASGSVDTGSPKFAVATIPKSIDDIFGDVDSFTNINNNNISNNNKNNGSTQPEANNAFDNLSSASGSPSTIAKHNRPNLDSIRSAIKSATTMLEKQQSSGVGGKVDVAKSANPKKASDDLFSLLDTTTVSTDPNSQTTAPAGQLGQSLVGKSDPVAPSTILAQQLNSTSPFSASSPFNLPPIQSNGQQILPLKPSNPFPDTNSDFAGQSLASAFAPQIQSTMGNSVLKPGVQTANYTNLGGLEGFGDLLQPMSTSNKGSSNSSNSASNKPSFSANSGLPSTGLFKGDLDTTLANLAQNLMDGITKTKK